MKFRKTKKFIIGLAAIGIISITGIVLGISGFFGNGSAIPSDTMTRNLAGYWNFEDGRGTTTADISGNSNTGKFMTAATSPQWTQGKVGGALNFDGTNSYVEVVDSTSLDIADTITIEMWVKSTVSSGSLTKLDRLLEKNNSYALDFNHTSFGGKANFGFSYNGTDWTNVQYSTTLSANTWMHLAATYDGQSMRVYLNGVQDNSLAETRAIVPSNNNAYIGTYGTTPTGTYNFSGLIDEVRVYNRALSAQEIRYHYNQGGPVAYWKFDEGATTTAYDSSGNDNNGTLTNMNVTTATSSWVQGRYGSALSFDGVNDYVTVASTTSLNPTSALTLEAWVKKDQTKNQNIIFNDVHELKIDSSNNAVLRLMTGARSGADMDMETAGVGSWVSFNAVDTKEKNATNPIQGAQDLHIVDASDNVGAYQSIGGLTSGLSYTHRIKFSYKVVSGALKVIWQTDTYNNNIASNLTGSGTSIIYATYTPTNTWVNIIFATDGGAGEFYVDDVEVKQVGATFTSNGTVSNDFTHIAATYSASTLKIYINGALDKNISQAVTLSTDSLATLIGAGAVGGAGYGQDYFNGTIDDVRIYSYARSPDEIRLDYNAGLSALFGPQFGCDRDPGSCMTKGLAGYWNFEDGRGTTTADISGNSNTGKFMTAATSPQWTQGKVGGGLSFDGTNDYVDVADSASLDITSAITISAWVKTTNTASYNIIVAKNDSANGFADTYSLRVDQTTGYAYGRIGDNVSATNDITGTTNVADGNWHYIVFAYDANSLYLYVDGKSDKTPTSKTITTFVNTTNLHIGFWATTWYPFNGLIDEVRVYNRALSAEEIRYHYNRGGPIVQWKFDEGTGATAYDSSINKYSGSLGNDMATSSWVSGKYGSAINFDGVEDFVSVSDSGATNAKIISKGTISLWLKPNDVVNKQGIIQLGDSWGDTNAISLAISSSQTISLYLNVSAGADKTISKSSLGWNPGDWHHVAATWDSSANVSKLYIDGVAVTTDAANTLTADVDVFWIGKTNRVPDTSATYFFNGSVDDVRIYDYARNPEQIIQDYSSGFSAYMGPTSAGCDRDPGSCMTKGLAGYWNFEDGRGTTTADISGNANTLRSLTAAVTPGWVQGKYGSSLQFDGSDDIVSAPDSATLKFGTGDFSAEIWVNTAQSAGGSTYPIYIAKDDEQATRSGWTIYQNGSDSNQVHFAVLSGGTEAAVDSGTTVNDGKWHHLVLVKTSSKIEGFIDGVSKGITAHTLGSTDKAVPLEIGNKAGVASRASSGTFDDARVYNRALSVQEIRYHYNKGGPVAYWKLDEGSGATAYDSSINTNTGTLTNMNVTTATSSWVRGKQGSALFFDGVNDYVNIGNSSSTDLTTALTLEAWVKWGADQRSPIISKQLGNDEIPYHFRIEVTSRKLYFATYYNLTEYGAFSTNVIPLNEWTHVAVTFNKPNLNFYINGVNSDWVNFNHTLPINAAALRIGNYSGNYFNGLLDDARIYNYARTPEQILQDYNGGKSVHFR